MKYEVAPKSEPFHKDVEENILDNVSVVTDALRLRCFNIERG
jgi:hypothetical protein